MNLLRLARDATLFTERGIVFYFMAVGDPPEADN
jgi:hypothetical protein